MGLGMTHLLLEENDEELRQQSSPLSSHSVINQLPYNLLESTVELLSSLKAHTPLPSTEHDLGSLESKVATLESFVRTSQAQERPVSTIIEPTPPNITPRLTTHPPPHKHPTRSCKR
jgi:hypothetical protein